MGSGRRKVSTSTTEHRRTRGSAACAISMLQVAHTRCPFGWKPVLSNLALHNETGNYQKMTIENQGRYDRDYLDKVQSLKKQNSSFIIHYRYSLGSKLGFPEIIIPSVAFRIN
jgi:hypothetical protein